MKIAVFTDGFSPQINGVVTHLNSSLPLLAQKNTIHVFAPRISKEYPHELQHKNIAISTYRGIPLPVYQDILVTSPYYHSMYKEIAAFKPDVIHVHTPFTMGANGVIAAKRLNKALVQTFHTYVNEPEYLRHLKLHRIGMDKSMLVQEGVWAVLNFFYGPADVIVCPSETTTSDLLQRFPNKKVVTISNGIDIKALQIRPPQKSATLKRYNIPGKYFLYVGRTSVEKNIYELIDGFVASRLAEKGVSLVIVGKGPYFKKVQNHAKRSGAAAHIIFTGERPHNEVIHSGILHHALAFVSASTSETQGITLLEAMAAGLPLIVVESKAVSELVHENGIVCAPHIPKNIGAALRTLYKDAALQKKFSKKSLQNITQHDIKKSVQLLEGAYFEAISIHAHLGADKELPPRAA